MSTREQIRGISARGGAPAVGAAHGGGSALRADLEAVWAISSPDGPGAAADAVLSFTAALLQQAAAEDEVQTHVEEAHATAELVSELAGLSEPAARRVLFRHASRRLAVAGGDPAGALATQLRLLVMLAPVTAGSVWLRAGGVVELAATTHRLAATRRCKRAAELAVDGDDVTVKSPGSRVRIHAYPLRQRGRRAGAVVIRLGADAYQDALPFLEEFALVFSSLREREQLLQASSSDGRRLGQTYERRLVRTAYDLHDGPLQDLAALAADLRLLRSQVGGPEAPPCEVVEGRIDDLAARVTELDHSLRAITQSLETSTLADRPLGEALQREVEAFRRRTSVAVELVVSGGLDALTMSQRIAVVRIVQEALSNIRAHSGATEVRVSLLTNEQGLELRVADNGRGFDLRATAAAAARRGRLGIVGMNERVRLLGGLFSIESVPGAGTTVSASIPAWRPLATG